MTPNELALDLLNQELKQAETIYHAARGAMVDDILKGFLFSDLVECGARTLIRREFSVEFWKLTISTVRHHTEKENMTIVQALDRTYKATLDNCLMLARSANNCTCALTNASKSVKLATMTELVESLESIIRYFKKEIKAE